MPSTVSKPGQIRGILDPIAYVSAVENVIASGGGSDVEHDDRFRLRIVNAFERISKAGPREGYVENVKAVNPSIVDVAVIRPQPGYIEITPLMLTGVSSDAVDAAILGYLDPETLIPMGDYVSIVKAGNQVFDITLDVRVVPSYADGIEQRIEDAVRRLFYRELFDEAGNKIKVEGWSVELGSQIAPSAILGTATLVDGVINVTGPGFDYTDLTATQFATIGQFSVKPDRGAQCLTSRSFRISCCRPASRTRASKLSFACSTPA